MKIMFLIAMSVFIFFDGCEQPLQEEEFPYEIKLVIKGVLEPGKLIDDIYIGRTLPINAEFDEDFANLTDAVAAVVSDGVFYPLRHIHDGIYTTDSLIVGRGKTYYLVAQWQDKSISATTSIPMPGKVLNYGIKSLEENGKQVSVMEATIEPLAVESYTITWVFVYPDGLVSREADNFVQVNRSLSGEQIKVHSDAIPPALLNTSTGKLGIRVYVYDSAFYDYFQAQGSTQISESIFGQPLSNVKWNIEGEGIGLFVGRTDTLFVE
jgi:hypothetical protein